MSEVDRVAIRARLNAATPEPWLVDSDGWIVNGGSYVVASSQVWNRAADRNFTAHARADVGALLDLADAVAEAIEHARAGFDDHPHGTVVLGEFYDAVRSAARGGDTRD